MPGAILFDLLSGGNKNWGRYPPYRELGYEAAKLAADNFALGSVGAGLGATTVNLKGGIGSASAKTRSGLTVGAIAAANAAGSMTVGDGPHFWAAPFEQDKEFGAHGWPTKFPPDALKFRSKAIWVNTTLAVVATDATHQAQAKRLAVMAHGVTRTYPVHTRSMAMWYSRGMGAKPCPTRYFSANSECLQPGARTPIARGVTGHNLYSMTRAMLA